MTGEFQNVVDWYQRGPFRPYVVRHHVVGAVPIHIVLANEPAGNFSDPALPELMVGMHRRGAPVRSVFDVGAGRFDGVGKSGSIYLVPPKTASVIEVDGPHQVLAMSLPVKRADFGRLHAGPFENPALAAAMERLWAIGSTGGEALAAEEAAAMLVNVLVADSEDGPAEVGRVQEFVRDNLGGEISLGAMAREAGLSVFHFCRSFQAAVGLSPYQYVVQQRLEAGRRLLRTTKMSVSEIATLTGFANQGHFSNAFRRAVGVGPTRYRRMR